MIYHLGRVCFLCMLLVLGIYASDMSEKEFRTELRTYQKREETAKSSIAALEAEIAGIKQLLDSKRQSTQQLQAELHGKMGVTPEQFELYLQQFTTLEQKVQEFTWAYAQDLRLYESAVIWAESQMVELMANPLAKLEAVQASLESCSKSVIQARELFEKRKTEVQNAWNADQSAIPVAEPPPAPKVEPIPEPVPVVEPEPEPVVQPTPAPIPQEKSEPAIVVVSESQSEGRVIRVGEKGQTMNTTLWDISRRVYGDPHKWQRIWRANWPAVQDPNRIYPGQTLVIPNGPVKKPAGMK